MGPKAIQGESWNSIFNKSYRTLLSLSRKTGKNAMPILTLVHNSPLLSTGSEACFLLSKPQMRNCTFEAANTNWPLYLRLLCQNMSRVIDDFERRKLAVKKHWKLKKSVGVHQKDSKRSHLLFPSKFSTQCDLEILRMRHESQSHC